MAATHTGAPPRLRRAEGIALLSALALLVLTRSPHLAGAIDDPHSWRQCDTAHYAWDFFRNGVKLLHPSVCWMGGHGTLVLEFPLVESVMAAVFHLFGYGLFQARLVALAFFAVSATYLFLLARLMVGRAVASLAVVIYVVLPLSQFYSRALVIDFAALGFCEAMAYHLISGVRSRSLGHAITGVATACMAILVKVPYFLCLAPVVAYALATSDGQRRWKWIAALASAPALTFVVWNFHVHSVNASAPDWSFIPGYRKLTEMWGWYFGSWSMRWDPEAWKTIALRMRYEVATLGALALALPGLVLRKSGDRPAHGRMLVVTWIAGTGAYLLVFFNLNVVHDYYQIPFLPVVAVLAAAGLDALRRLISRWSELAGWLALVAGVAVIVVEATTLSERAYYHVDWVRVEAGQIIATNTSDESLVIAAMADEDTDCRDPRLLQRAHRQGWSIAIRDLSPQLVQALRELGAKHLAIVTPARHPGGLEHRRSRVFRLTDDRWAVILVDLED